MISNPGFQSTNFPNPVQANKNLLVLSGQYELACPELVEGSNGEFLQESYLLAARVRN